MFFWVWTIGDLLNAALAAEPPKLTPAAPDRRRQFRVIEGGAQMMNFLLCSPNGGLPLIGLGAGGIAAIIWMVVKGRYRQSQSPDDPVRRLIFLDIGRLFVLLGCGTGFIIGLILSQFISLRC